eukprot:gene3157-13170_t
MVSWPNVAARMKLADDRIPAGVPLAMLSTMVKLFIIREARLLRKLGQAMAGASKADSFDEWMKKQSDLVQATAFAFGERELTLLFALRSVESELSWFMVEEILPLQAGKQIPDAVRATVQQIGPTAHGVVDAFGIPDHLVAAPIAGDWEKYNIVDNRGELLGVNV